MVEFLNRYVSIEKEGGGSYGTDPDSAPVYGEVDDESFSHKYDLLTRQDMSRPVASKSVTGTEYSEGGINMALQIDDFVGNILGAFFPNTAYSSAIHSFDEPTAAGHVYSSYTIKVGREQKEHTYTGMVANTLSMTADVGEYVMLSADFVGRAESATTALVSATFDGDALDALYFANGSVFFDDGTSAAPVASASVKSFSFDVALNRDQDNAYALGNSTYGRAPPSQRREISGTIEFNTVLYGDQTLDEPDYDQLIAADGLTYTDAALAPTIILSLQSEVGSNEYLKVNFYNVRFEAPEASVSGRDSNTMSVGFIGLYDANASGADKAMDMTMKGGSVQTSAY
jgi:hypothetical protein